MRRADREVWKRRVERWKASDLTAKEFAAEHGFNANTLIHWNWKFNKERRASRASEPQAERQRPEASTDSERSSLQFVELLRASPSSLGDDRIELVLALGVTVRVPTTFDDDTLRRVLAVVERR